MSNTWCSVERDAGRTDIYSPDKRSEVMSRVRSENTKPEMAVRSLLHAMGYRFRLHRKDLPGKPDIVLPRYRTVVFVHGCFWHQHPGCRKATIPKKNRDFWESKLARNQERDQQALHELEEAGWNPLVVWECEVRQPERLERKLARALSARASA